MTENKKKSLWGVGIAVVYGAFMVIMIGIVVASRFQPVDLVSRDYYDKEITYQKQIDRMQRSQQEGMVLTIDHNIGDGKLTVTFPAGFSNKVVTGHLKLFRPSSAALDRNFEISSIASQQFDAGKLARGLWKIKVDWQVDSLQYYHEQELYVN